MSCDSDVVLGERGAKCLVHRPVHRAVHLSGQPNLRGKRWMREVQRVTLYVPKALNWAGATPLLAKCLWPKDHGGRSSPSRSLRDHVLPACKTRRERVRMRTLLFGA